jgi:hypothetical protein
MSCDGKVSRAIAEVSTPAATRWRDSIDKVRKTSQPYQLELADALVEQLGGLPGIAERLASDVREMRGENLHPDDRAFFEPDRKTLKGMYELIMRLMQNRDAFIEQADPLNGLTEEELVAVASQACFTQLERDAAFRRAVMEKLAQIDSDAVIEFAVSLIGSSPRVEVIDA